MQAKHIISILRERGWIYAGLLVSLFFAYKTIVGENYAAGAILAFFPFILLIGFYLFNRSFLTLTLLFIANYFIMGVNRYAPIPASVVIDGTFGLLIASVLFKTSYEFTNWRRVRNGLTFICFVWFIYCTTQLLNNATNLTPLDWLQGVRAMAIYPLLTVILFSLLMKDFRDLQWLLVLWAFFTLLAAAKGYWQRNRGFDPYEIRWLYMGDGARTHLIHTGVRYFSFFTDAGNFGSSMGFSMVVFTIASLFIKNKFLKIYFLIAGLAGGYGMLISGTRGALAVPFAGYTLFTLLSKNWKLFLATVFFIGGSYFVLRFTSVGSENQLIERMRTAFDPDDASLQVRLQNQRELRKFMSDLSFGVGIGAHAGATDVKSKAWTIVKTPPDSWLVRIWTRTGIIGLVLYLSTWAAILIGGSYIILFRIKNKELRGLLAGMLCGTFGMMVSAYGNDFYTQYPNGILIYGCQALVFIGPYIDKGMTEKKEKNKLLALKENEPTA